MNKIVLNFLLLALIINPTWGYANNLIANSGFEKETNKGLPDGWSDGGWGLRNDYWVLNINEWQKSFSLDKQHKYQGKNSLKIVNQESRLQLSLYSCRINIPRFLKGANNWTLSAWIKTMKSGKVKLELLTQNYELIKSVTLNTDNNWQRYSLHSSLNKNTVVIRIIPDKDMTCWIDAVQLEKKNNATEYQNNEWGNDSFKSNGHIPKSNIYEIYKRSIPLIGNSPSSVKIDNRLLYFNNAPFIPYIFGLQIKTDKKFYQEIKKVGFNGVSFYLGTDEKRSNHSFSAAKAAGLAVVPWVRAPSKNIPELVKKYKNHPALLTWYAIDEPPEPFTPEVINRVNSFSKLDPKHPVLVNYRTNEINRYLKKLVKLPGDIISMDRYPLSNLNYPGDVTTCADIIGHMEKALASTDKAVWSFFQLTGYAFMVSREPAPEEFESMLYYALIKGCRGFLFFQNRPRFDALLKTAGIIGLEIQYLAPVIYADGPAQIKISCSSKAIKYMKRKHNGRLYLISVNTSPQTVKCTFSILGKRFISQPLDIFEERKIKWSGKGRFEDTFLPYQRHVYSITLP
jgi:hypothetical protein